MVELKIINGDSKYNLKTDIGSNLLGVLNNKRIEISAPCGGEGRCGKCLVKIHKGAPTPTGIEREMISSKNLDSGYRLACETSLTRNMVVEVPSKGQMEIMTGGMEINIKVDPYLKDIPYNEGKDFYGVAVDIGTTTVVLYLLNLATGEEIDQYSITNPQQRFGADVISRVNYTLKEENNIAEVQEMLLEGLNQALNQLLVDNNIDNHDVYQVTVAGNTIMLHTLLGVSAESITRAPYTPQFTDDITISPQELGLEINSGGEISLLPSISGYVGADIVADMLVLETIRNKSDWRLLIDIGTNGEMVLDNGEKTYACSTAAGPALEGANIKHGMAGVPGAISSFEIDEKGKKEIETIGNKPVQGICGSGLIDIVAQLIKNDLLNKDGSLVTEGHDIIKYKKQPAYQVTERDDEQILLTQKDVRELQLAKGAIEAGTNILLKEAGLDYSQVENLYLAGGFGNYICPQSACTIKLVPPELEDRIIQMGNGAGLGARMYLLNKNMREKARQIKTRTRYIELSNREDFQTEFMEAMYF